MHISHLVGLSLSWATLCLWKSLSLGAVVSPGSSELSSDNGCAGAGSKAGIGPAWFNTEGKLSTRSVLHSVF